MPAQMPKRTRIDAGPKKLSQVSCSSRRDHGRDQLCPRQPGVSVEETGQAKPAGYMARQDDGLEALQEDHHNQGHAA